MNKIYTTFVENFADENSLPLDRAEQIITWLEKTGVLDFQEIKNVYTV